MNSTKVSVVIPIYNMEKCLERCVNSVLQQTYKNIEIILVDDGSKDDSPRICLRLEEENDNVIAICKTNGGVSTARNAGITRACGEWIMFVDPDDYLDHHIIEELIRKADDGTDIVMCTCMAIDGEKMYRCHFFDGDMYFDSDEKKLPLFHQLLDMKFGQSTNQIYTAVGVPWGKLYRRELLKKNNLEFNPELKRAQDNIFNMYAMCYARKIIYLDKALYMYSFMHMGDYFNKYRKDYVDIFRSVMLARFDAMNALGLLEVDELYCAYVNDALGMFASILKNGVFHKKNSCMDSDKINQIKECLSDNCFRVILSFKSFMKIDSLKYKLFWILLKFRMMHTLKFICKIYLSIVC